MHSSYNKTVSVEQAEQNIAQYIDHTLLKPEATQEDIRKLCEEARFLGVAAVCVNPVQVSFSAKQLRNSSIAVATVIGFPLGANTATIKAAEAQDALLNGATEMDMVINIGALKAGRYRVVRQDIEGVINAASGNIVKVIIETAFLTDQEKETACRLAREAGAHFVKTSTGFSKSGAQENDVKLMRRTVGETMGIKAAGGIRSFPDALRMIAAGANRIGASATLKIVRDQSSRNH